MILLALKKVFFLSISIILVTFLSLTAVSSEEKKIKKEEEKPLTLEDLDKLGTIVLLKKLPTEMFEKLKSCKPYNANFSKCEGIIAGKIVGTTFRKKGGYGEKYPGKMMEAMAYFEILYLTSLHSNKKKINRFKENIDKKEYFYKEDDVRSIRSLIKMNKGREKMRSALGMTLETPTEDAIKRFWTLGEFLALGEPKKIGKLDKDVKKRRKLLQEYKSTVLRLKEKLEEE
jgi:hypothetical protein